MDRPRERLLATLLGGAGTVFSILIYQAIPDLIRFEHLSVRLPNAIYFVLGMFAVGALSGRAGHRMFVRMTRFPLRTRALITGIVIGTSIALVGWFLTYLFRDALFPLSPVGEASRFMTVWLRNALIAGPVIAVLISLLIARRFVSQRQ